MDSRKDSDERSRWLTHCQEWLAQVIAHTVHGNDWKCPPLVYQKLHYTVCNQSLKIEFIAKLKQLWMLPPVSLFLTDTHTQTGTVLHVLCSKYNLKARVDAALLSHTQTSAQTSNGPIKAPDDLCCEKLVETLEPSSRFSQPSHSARSLWDGKAFKLDSQWGSAQSALRRRQNRVLYSFLWRVGNTSCYASPK